MKKILTAVIISLFAGFAFSEGYFLNRIGASADADGTEFGSDLFTIDEDDKSDMHFAEYAEFGYFWDKAEVAGVFAINNLALESPQENILAAGYGIFSPLPFISVAAGNDTRDRFSFSGGELYTENEAFLLQANPFADGAGLVFNQLFGNFDVTALASIGAAKGIFLNAGAQVSYENDSFYAVLQLTGQNLLNKNDYYHYALFGTASFSDFDFSAGYISNYNDQSINDFDREEDFEQDYLPLPSTHVVKVSARYTSDLFMVAVDGLTGLNKEYILNEDCKKLRAAYDAWADADFDPVVQGCDEEDGALGENENIPWLAAVKGGWFATEDISIYLKYSISHGTDFTHIIYPYTDWAFGENSIFRLGARIKVKDEKVSVSVPLMWQVKFDIK